MDKIEKIIIEANLEEICKPRQGDCEKVAMSMKEVFDIDCFISVYEPGENKHPTHAAVKINGKIYDGKGRISKKSLKDFLSGMRLKDFGLDKGEHDKMDKIIEEELIVEQEPKDNAFPGHYDKEIIERLKNKNH